MKRLSLAHRLYIILGLAVLTTGSALADIPLLVNYQGRLADENNQPVDNDMYEMVFSLWIDSTSTDPADMVWTSGPSKIEVINGLFNHALGTNAILTSDIFVNRTDLFLSVYVEGFGDLEARQRITSAGFSFQSLVADTAYEVAGDPYLHADGDTLRDHLRLQLAGGQMAGKIHVGAGGADLFLYNDEHNSASLYGESYGSLYLYQGDGGRTVILDGRSYSGGLLSLRDTSGTTAVELDGGKVGDAAVILPEGSVNAIEMLNEPGIAHKEAHTTAGRYLETSYMQFDSVSITIPGPGYVFLLGCAYIMFNEDVSTGAYVQISDVITTTTYIHAMYLYYDGTGVVGNTTIPVSLQRVMYEESAGTYKYYLQARRTITAAVNVYIARQRLTAIYIPTSYGEVSTAAADPGDDPDATMVSFTDETGEEQTAWVTDLRYYELKAKEARLKALEAELELEKARDEAAERERRD